MSPPCRSYGASTWSSAPRLLCKSSYYTGTVGWLTLEALDAMEAAAPSGDGAEDSGLQPASPGKKKKNTNELLAAAAVGGQLGRVLTPP